MTADGATVGFIASFVGVARFAASPAAGGRRRQV